MYTLKEPGLIPPDGKIVFAVPRDMEWIIVVIHDSAGNELLRMPIERREHLLGGATVRTYWDGRFIGWKGTGAGKWYRADPSRGNYFYTVIGEEKVEAQLPPVTPEDLIVPPEIFEEGQPARLPTWMWAAIIGIGALLLFKKK